MQSKIRLTFSFLPSFLSLLLLASFLAGCSEVKYNKLSGKLVISDIQFRQDCNSTTSGSLLPLTVKQEVKALKPDYPPIAGHINYRCNKQGRLSLVAASLDSANLMTHHTDGQLFLLVGDKTYKIPAPGDKEITLPPSSVQKPTAVKVIVK
jgi:hypothetical protein